MGIMTAKSVSMYFAISSCSLSGGIGTISDLTLSDLRFLTVDPTARELSALYMAEELRMKYKKS